MESLTMRQQIELIASSSGIFSVEGAAFSHQVFLPPAARLIIAHVPRDGGTCSIGLWHTAVAQYLRFPVLDWHVCGDCRGEAILQMMESFVVKTSGAQGVECRADGCDSGSMRCSNYSELAFNR